MGNFTVGELCAGVGGMGLGFKNQGYDVLWANEIDEKACVTYRLNFQDTRLYEMSIFDLGDLPYVDVITAGFPCQPFSVAGLRKGFDDERGNVFEGILKVVKQVQPKVLMLENVRGLLSHAGGDTITRIVEGIDEAGYSTSVKVIGSAISGGVPQDRWRVYMVCHLKGLLTDEYDNWPIQVPTPMLRTFLDKKVGEKYYYEKYTCHDELAKVMTDRDRTYQWRRKYVRVNKANRCPTLTANMGTGGHNVPLIVTDDDRIRKLTPRECFRLQGFPDDFLLPATLADCHLYKQAGNAVTVGVVGQLAQLLGI